jgi:hypothetical protein
MIAAMLELYLLSCLISSIIVLVRGWERGRKIAR